MKTQNDLLALLRAEFYCQQVAIMVGAGISLNSGMPIVYGNNGLVPSILNRLGMLEKDIKLILSYKFPFEGFIEQLKAAKDLAGLLNIFEGSKPSLIHYFLGELYKKSYINTVLTTNFDTLIEKTITDSEVKVLYDASHFECEKWSSNNKFLIKIHGCVSNKEDMAITLSQVASSNLSNSRKKALEKVFTRQLHHKSILIMGYSASDIFDLSPVIENLSNKDISIYYISHSMSNDFKVNLISNVSNIETGEKITEGGVAVKNPFKSYQGYWISVNTDNLIKQLWGLIFESQPKDKKYKVNWQANVDSWTQKISQSSKYSLCVKVLNEICEYDRSIYYLNILKKSNDSYENIVGRLNNAIFKHRQGDHEFAIKEYTYCLNTKGLPKPYYPQIQENLAKVLNEVGRYDESISNGKLAMNGYELLNDISAIIRTKRTLANSYTRNGKLDKGLKLAKESYKKALEIGDIKSAAYGRIAAATAFSQLTQYLSAIDQLQKVEVIGIKVDDKYICATAYNNLGAMYMMSHISGNKVDLKSGRKYVEQGIKLAKDLGDIHSIKNSTALLEEYDREIYNG